MEKDITWSDFFEDNSRYADIINGLGCAGSQLIAPEDLSELDTKKRTKTRDLIRKAALGMNFVIIDFKDIPETLKNMVSDYKIQVIDIRRLQDTSIFKTDVRHVFDFLRCCNDSNALVQLISNEEYYQHVNEDAYEVISKYANTKGIINLEKFKNQNGGIDMCKGLRDLITDSKAEGHEAGLIEGHELGLNEGRELGLNEGRAEALVHTYQKLNQPKDDAITALVDDYAIPKEDALKLVEKYWK